MPAVRRPVTRMETKVPVLKILTFLMAVILLVTASRAMTSEMDGNDMSCPDAPRCVSSQADDPRHFIKPFSFHGSPAEAMQRLRQALLSEKRVTIISEQPGYLHAEVRSLVFRFVDDVKFVLQAGQGLIHVYSSAQAGYTDFGVNRRRIERIRQVFQG